MTESLSVEGKRQIGHYELDRCIGRGGMGVVYLARDLRLDRQVAVKCLHAELYEPNYRERFRREALILAKLNHPHIVHIYDFIETPDQLALVMEYVDGDNLQRHLREHCVAIRQRLEWIVQIADGLAVAHDAGIIHRDLKLENVLINQRHHIKISDFGIARSEAQSTTVTDAVVGSYASMSPEQAMGERVDLKSDLFSLGVLAYQMLCQAHPFGDASNPLQIMQRIISHPPIHPSQKNPNLHPDISALLLQLLSKQSERRPESAHWVASECRRLLAALTLDESALNDTAVIPRRSDASPSNPLSATDEIESIASQQTALSRSHAILSYLKKPAVWLGVCVVGAVMLAAFFMKPFYAGSPKYIAVLPPTLVSDQMLPTRQALVKASVFDAIQQSALELPSYYVIPRNQVAEVSVQSTDQLDAVSRALGADEMIATDVRCKAQVCAITLDRLALDDKTPNGRMRLINTKRIEVPVDAYISLAESLGRTLSSMFNANLILNTDGVDEKDYQTVLSSYYALSNGGASKDILEKLDGLSMAAKKTSSVQTLYREMALDMYYETSDEAILDKFFNMLEHVRGDDKNHSRLLSLFYLQLAKNQLSDATATLNELKQVFVNETLLFELNGLLLLAKNDFVAAMSFYQRALTSKASVNNFYNLALAQYYAGRNSEAKNNLKNALELAPAYFKGRRLYATILLVEGDAQAAVESFKRIVAVKPDDVSSLSNLGLCYLLLRDYTSAITVFDQALQFAPTNTTFLLNKADAHSLLGNSESSRGLYQAIAESQKDHLGREELRNMAQAHAHLGHASDAIKILQELQRVDSQSAETQYTAALVQTLVGDGVSAVVNAEAALKNNMNKVWFSFSWFDNLCQRADFVALMHRYGDAERCALQLH